jgi:hypothetical protein
MPIDYERDDAKRRIIATGRGPFRLDEVIEILGRLRVDDAWRYPALFDMRFITGHPKVHELRIIVDAAGRGPHQEPRGPTAIVANDSTLYGMACAYAAINPPGRVEVFRDRSEAERWLDKRVASQD